MKLNCEFFYGKEADSFRFYRIPQVLVTDERFKDLSCGAKILYGLFLDRVGLSNKNGWRDELGRTFIIYSISEVMEDMNCSKVTAIKMTNELEKAGLLEKKRRGLGMPNVMYLKKFIAEV